MITHLQLNNWKAFTDRKKFNFREGISFIVGKNGSGKTSILEGISTALIGKTLTSDNPFNSIRDNKIPTEIELGFSINGKAYLVNRTFKDGRSTAFLQDEKEGQKIKGWNSVNQKITRLMNVEEIFFSRLVYMSEGEVYRYIDNPPKQAISSRIKEIFGLESIFNFTKILHRNKIYYSNLQKDIRDSIRKISISDELSEEVISELNVEIKELRDRKKVTERDKERTEREIQNIEAEQRHYERILDISASINKEIKTFDLIKNSEKFSVKNLQKLKTISEKEIKKLETKINRTNKESGALQNKISYQNDIHKMLLSVLTSAEKKKSVPCPVCKRPIHEIMAKELLSGIKKEQIVVENNLINLTKMLEDLNMSNETLKNNLSSLNELLLKLEQIPEKIIGSIPALDEALIRKKLQNLDKKLDNTNKKAESISQLYENLSKELEEKIEKISTLRSELKQIGVKSKLDSRLVSAYKGEIITEYLEQALKNTLTQQRDKNLVPIYKNISYLWNKFKPESSWQVELDDDGTMLMKEKGGKIYFNQLSGGEKTVLLVLARALICKSLSDVDFLMIDEPLEHLDIRNRRSLLNFLVEASKKEVILQLLVTTFEETLIRKFYTNKNIQIIYLN